MIEPTTWKCEHCKADNRTAGPLLGTPCYRCGLWHGYDYSTFPAQPKHPPQSEVQK